MLYYLNNLFSQNIALTVLFSGIGVAVIGLIFKFIVGLFLSNKRKEEQDKNKPETKGNGNIISPKIYGSQNTIIGNQYNNMDTEQVGKSTVDELLRQCPQLSESRLSEEFKNTIQTIWTDLLFHTNSVATEKCLSCKQWREVEGVFDIMQVINELDEMGYRKVEIDDLEVITRLYTLKTQIDNNTVTSMSKDTQEQYLSDFYYVVDSIPSYANAAGI
jgi:hypothetical protein